MHIHCRSPPHRYMRLNRALLCMCMNELVKFLTWFKHHDTRMVIETINNNSCGEKYVCWACPKNKSSKRYCGKLILAVLEIRFLHLSPSTTSISSGLLWLHVSRLTTRRWYSMTQSTVRFTYTLWFTGCLNSADNQSSKCTHILHVHVSVFHALWADERVCDDFFSLC